MNLIDMPLEKFYDFMWLSVVGLVMVLFLFTVGLILFGFYCKKKWRGF